MRSLIRQVTVIVIFAVVAGCATSPVDSMIGRNDFVAAYSNVLKDDSLRKERAAIVEKIKSAANRVNSDEFATQVLRSFSYSNKTPDFFIESSEIIRQAQGDGLITKNQAVELSGRLFEVLSNEIIENPSIIKFSKIRSTFPDVEKIRNAFASKKLQSLIETRDDDLEKYFPLYNHFKSIGDNSSLVVASDGMKVAIVRKSSQTTEFRATWQGVKPLLEYVAITGDHSLDVLIGNLIKNSQLSKIDFENIKPIFPVLYEEEIARRLIKLDVRTDGDSFVADEIVDALKAKNQWIEIGADAELKIDFIRLKINEQRVGPFNMTETVSNLNFATLLFVPKNASVLFDYLTTEYSLQWNFRVQKNIGKKAKGISGSRQAKKIECRNIRYQNVFGGTGPIDIYPNDLVENFCTKNVATDFDKLRINVVDEIAQEINNFITN